MAARRGGRRRLRQDPRCRRRRARDAGRRRRATTLVGGRTPAGGRTGSPTAPTPSTRSRSCRWPPSTSPARGRVLDVGMRRGPGRPAGRRPAARRASSASTRPAPRSSWRAERGGGPAYARAGAAVAAVRRRERSTPWSPASCSSTSTRVDAAIAEVGRVLAPGGRFLFFLNHPLLQTPNSGWIDDQVLDPPEQYWRIGAVPRRGRARSRRWRRTCSSRSSTGRSAAT